MKKKGHVIYILIIAVVLVICGALFYDRHRIYAEEQNLLQTYMSTKIPEIVCIGDSLTAGTGGEGVSYPAYMEELLWKDSLYIPVRNLHLTQPPSTALRRSLPAKLPTN